MDHRLFLTAYFLLPAAALLLARALPGPWVMALLTPLAAFLYWRHRRHLQRAAASLDEDRKENGVPLARGNPYLELTRRAEEFRQRHDETVLRLVNANIQLLSVRELWQALAQPGRLDHTVDGALLYCHRASGFQEVLILRLEPETKELVGRWLHPGTNGPLMESLRWALGGLSGAVATVLRTPRTLMGDPAASEPLLRVNGEAPRGLSAHSAYLVVPLLAPFPRQECLEGGWLYHDDCPVFEASSAQGLRTHCAPQEGARLHLGPCLCCRHYPLYGLMVVTDHGRDAGIHKADRLTLESLSYAVSAILQNASLYAEVQREEHFRDRILDGMTNGLFTADHRGRVIFVNRRAMELLGKDGSRLVGTPLDEHLVIPGRVSPFQSVIDDRGTLLRTEGFLRGGEGKQIPVLINAAPYQKEEGGRHGVIVVVEDLSAVQAMQEEIRHLDTLAAIGRFASSMAHEIRNPLGGISAGMDYLERNASIQGAEAESLEMIRSEITRLDRIIRRLFQVARPVRLEPVETDPAETAARAQRASAGWAAQKGVELVVETKEGGKKGKRETDQIHQVLINLVKNAVEASHPGSKVVLRVGLSPASSTPGGMEEGVAFEVIDHGEGIAPGDLVRIFEPFYTAKAEGTGLGLFVSHSIVQRHGGVLQVESHPGEQTSFRVLLPLVPALLGSCP